MKLLAAVLLAAGLASAQAPVFDNSGNKLLSGTDYFRQVAFTLSDTAGDIGAAVVLYGSISFDGNGNYSITSQELDTGAGTVQSITASGTYTISASGYGYLTNPISTTSLNIYGLVSNGIFIGSSTEQTGFSDLFIAAPLTSSSVATSVFNGSYTVAYFSPGGSVDNSVDASFQISPNGSGSLGTVNMSGYVGQSGSTPYTQSSTNVKYVISNGAANIMFPNSSTANFIVGNEYAYISPDGNFIFGGSPDGFDMFVGVKTGTASGFGGLYYTAGMQQNAATLASGYADLNTFYGSFSAAANGSIIGHERLTSGLRQETLGFSYGDTFPSSGGTFTDSTYSTKYTTGAGGKIQIGSGIGPLLGISVAVQAPGFSGSGVYLNPAGVVNAASFAPFTSGVSPGEFITLYGTNLAPSEQVAAGYPFPATLNGVEVLINGTPAPIYYVSPTQISVIVPYETTYAIAQIQVKNAGAASNAVSLYVNKTTPGVFTNAQDGLGVAAALHPNFKVVTESAPAQIGETVSVYLTGLGDVVPAVGDGVAASTTILSQTTNTITATVGGVAATVTFAGLAPGYVGLYQVNLTIPAGLTAGDNVLGISGPDSYNAEATLPITTTAAVPNRR